MDPVETYGWEIDDLLKVALRKAPQEAVTTANEFLDLLERKYTRSVPEREIAKFEEIVKNLAPVAMALAIRLTQRAASQELKADATAWLSLAQMIRLGQNPKCLVMP